MELPGSGRTRLVTRAPDALGTPQSSSHPRKGVDGRNVGAGTVCDTRSIETSKYSSENAELLPGPWHPRSSGTIAWSPSHMRQCYPIPLPLSSSAVWFIRLSVRMSIAGHDKAYLSGSISVRSLQSSFVLKRVNWMSVSGSRPHEQAQGGCEACTVPVAAPLAQTADAESRDLHRGR